MSQFPEIADYQIQRELGSGGFATAYLAQNVALHREEVLKVMHPHIAADTSFRQRFAREARLVARLRHNHIVQIYRVGEHDDIQYLALEYCEGGNLAERMQRGVSVQEALAITMQLSDALSHAHAKGIVHRDIKPENVLFRDDGSTAITDFGIAKAMEGATQLTGTGFAIGTPHYMRPEQLRGEAVDGKADFYALGVVLYQMLSGTLPFSGDSFSAIMYGHLEKPVPELPARTSRFQRLINGLLEKEVGKRIGSADEVRGCLTEIEGEQTVKRTAPSESPPEPVRNTSSGGWRTAVLIVLLVALPAVFAYLYQTAEAPIAPEQPGMRAGLGDSRPEDAAEVIATYPFSVKTTPDDARVRIMNIAPAYQPDMMLAPGVYQVEVSRPGYLSHSYAARHDARGTQDLIMLNADLSGRWQGEYADRGMSIPFYAEFSQQGVDFQGRSEEYGPNGEVLGAFWRGTVLVNEIQLFKTYDGSGGNTHEVRYFGTYNNGGVTGNWRSGAMTDRFAMRRQ